MKMFAKMISILPTLAVLALTMPQFARGAELDSANVPADAKWLVHVDLEALCNSELAEAYREKWPEKVERFREKMRERYAIDPQDDLKSLTLFSDSYKPHSGAAIVTADFDRDEVEKTAREYKGVKTSKWRDYTLYTWKIDKHDKRGKHHHDGESSHHKDHHSDDCKAGNGSDGSHEAHNHRDKDKGDKYKKKDKDKKTVTAAIFDDNTVIFAGSEQRVKDVLKLLAGDASSLEGEDSRLISDVPDNAFLYGAAVDLHELKQRKRPFPVLRQHEHAELVVGQRDGELFKKLTLQAEDEETAEQTKEALEGLVALSKMMTAGIEDLSALYDNAEISRDGTTVTANWSGDVQEVVDGIEEACEQMKKHRNHKRKERDGHGKHDSGNTKDQRPEEV